MIICSEFVTISKMLQVEWAGGGGGGGGQGDVNL